MTQATMHKVDALRRRLLDPVAQGVYRPRGSPEQAARRSSTPRRAPTRPPAAPQTGTLHRPFLARHPLRSPSSPSSSPSRAAHGECSSPPTAGDVGRPKRARRICVQAATVLKSLAALAIASGTPWRTLLDARGARWRQRRRADSKRSRNALERASRWRSSSADAAAAATREHGRLGAFPPACTRERCALRGSTRPNGTAPRRFHPATGRRGRGRASGDEEAELRRHARGRGASSFDVSRRVSRRRGGRGRAALTSRSSPRSSPR